MSNTRTSGGNGLGCLANLALSVLLVGGVFALWFWSQGADPRAATADGLVLGTKIIAGSCAVLGALLMALLGFVVWAKR